MFRADAEEHLHHPLGELLACLAVGLDLPVHDRHADHQPEALFFGSFRIPRLNTTASHLHPAQPLYTVRRPTSSLSRFKN